MEKETVTLQDAKEHGLTEDEFKQIQTILGRVPNSTELGIFSGMWSEHCSYKNSILQLKTLPTDSPLTLAKAGEENAGALDIGDGLAVVFKIESHNHPTAIEPYQGAATGVGGIMRDIFTMGARPILSLNSLRFGRPEDAKNRHLLTRAVKGIGDYGNSLGIAVSGGELFFDNSFSKNPLVNAMTVGIADHGKMASATTNGKIGFPVFIVGATTGRDGIHGASFASQDLTAESESKRSAVQVGDPFMEKLLMEASLEAIQQGVLEGIQDMGAAGISCSTSEMSAKGKTGMEVNLDLVPMRETGMNAYEVMLSESQERMLVVGKPDKEKELIEIFTKWGLHIVQVGKVTEGKMLKILMGGKTKAEIPAESLVLGGGAPRYVRETSRPSYLDKNKSFKIEDIQDIQPEKISEVALRFIGSANLCSRRPLYEQYDTEVGLVKIIGPGGDGGLARIPGSEKCIGVSVDCNSRYTYLDPYWGTVHAVCESSRNVCVTGARPIGITNNLNFANPYNPDNYYIFTECVRGMGDALRILDLPVTGGNVSFYNESQDGPVFPTPTVGTVGVLDSLHNRLPWHFTAPDKLIVLVGKFRPTLGGSEYLNEIHGIAAGSIPFISPMEEKKLHDAICMFAEKKLVLSAKDISLGGLLIALMKKTFQKKIGIHINLPEVICKNQRLDTVLFGETSASIILSLDEKNFNHVQTTLQKSNLDCILIGKTMDEFKLSSENRMLYSIDLAEAEKKFSSGLEPVFRDA